MPPRKRANSKQSDQSEPSAWDKILEDHSSSINFDLDFIQTPSNTNNGLDFNASIQYNTSSVNITPSQFTPQIQQTPQPIQAQKIIQQQQQQQLMPPPASTPSSSLNIVQPELEFLVKAIEKSLNPIVARRNEQNISFQRIVALFQRLVQQAQNAQGKKSDFIFEFQRDLQQNLTNEEYTQFSLSARALTSTMTSRPQAPVAATPTPVPQQTPVTSAPPKRKQSASEGTRPIAASTSKKMKQQPSEIVMPSNAPAASGNAPGSQNQILDPTALQDVIQIAGVDLKAENEFILRQAESQQQFIPSSVHSKAQTAQQLQQQQLQQQLLSGLVKRVVQLSGLKKVAADVDEYLLMAISMRLLSILTQLRKISMARVEMGRDKYKLDLLDGVVLDALNVGPDRSRIGAVKRPLVWLEKFEKNLEGKLAIEFQGSVSEEGRIVYLEQEGEKAVEEQEQQQQPSQQEKGKQPKSALKERDDLVVRARLTNATALKAAGIGTNSKYSWMNESSVSSISNSQLPPVDQPTAAPGPVQQPTREQLAVGGFGLAKPATRAKILASRKITLQDLIFYFQQDQSTGEGSWGRLKRTALGQKLFQSQTRSLTNV